MPLTSLETLKSVMSVIWIVRVQLSALLVYIFSVQNAFWYDNFYKVELDYHTLLILRENVQKDN